MNEFHWKGKVNTSIIFPVIIIGIGIMFLFNNLGFISGEFWELLLKLWPIVLIAIGIDGIIKQESLAISSVLTILGIVFLFNNFDRLPFHLWEIVFRLWPLVLIAIGFDIVLGDRSRVISFLGMIVIAGLTVGVLWFLGIQTQNNQIVKGMSISQPVPTSDGAAVAINPVAGSLQVKAANLDDKLIIAQIPTGGSRNIDVNTSEEGTVLDYRLNGNYKTILTPSRLDRYSWDIIINNTVPMLLKTNLYAGEAEINLMSANIQELDIEMGLGKVIVKLPDSGNFTGVINSAMGDLVILVPEGLELKFSTNTIMAKIEIPEDYLMKEGVYYSPSYEGSENQAELVLGQGIGRIVVKTEE